MSNWQYSGSDQNSFSAGQIDKGYFVKLPDRDPATDFNGKTASAQITNRDGDSISLWLTKASIPFSIGGSFSQSVRLRQFFPRNLVQAKWILEGIVPNSFQYQRLAEFIRQTQLDCLSPTSFSATDYPLLTINAGALKNGKGSHNRQSAHGYIQHIQRGAERFINAPTYQFEFNILFAHGDLFISGNSSSDIRRIDPDLNKPKIVN